MSAAPIHTHLVFLHMSKRACANMSVCTWPCMAIGYPGFDSCDLHIEMKGMLVSSIYGETHRWAGFSKYVHICQVMIVQICPSYIINRPANLTYSDITMS